MVKSMTGYGRSEVIQDPFTFIVELRSVNHRYQETYLRIPRELYSIEDEIKKKIQEQVKRGRIDCTITMENKGQSSRIVEVDWDLAQGYYQAAIELKNRFHLNGDLQVADFLQFPNLFTFPKLDDVDQIKEVLLEAVRLACEKLTKMRISEGIALEQDLKERIRTIDLINDQIREQAPKVVRDYKERLSARIVEFLEGRAVLDEGRLLNEVAIYSDKANIEEETFRLKSHCQQFLKILSQDEPIGRKLDFLIQEMNREVNTIGSKANDLMISQLVVEAKSEIEKLREQVQNIE